ncbi:DUF3105 domain-containing protein [Paenibacillus sp. GCM10023248]|uniref:DUF3105 domain-containing protein n=1 Tax=Bacillales TaxID=1385 RepID=UPI002378660E|nr:MULTISPECIES: DUF3105 domain-containing protein [Bacillales]MDD9270952.1 DUF3105 domain-containing protein [Paenibacillus sp. MAHUQ-63]MDR6882913.1 flagellar basal body-associated protein FliL [Bacillus sp. 3255]
MEHSTLQDGSGVIAILLYIGLALFILAVIGYVFAAKTRKANTSKLKKAEKQTLQKKLKTWLILSHTLLILSICSFGTSLIQYSSSKYSVEKLNYNAPIQVTTDKDYGRDHSEDMLSYEMTIPTSGTHSPHDLKFGFYTERPTYAMLVHNLEHGDIILYFHPDAPKELQDKLAYLSHFKKAGAGVLAVANPDVPKDMEVVVTAWTKTMQLPKFDEASVGTFIYQNIDNGPEKIPSEVRRGGGTM